MELTIIPPWRIPDKSAVLIELHQLTSVKNA